MFADLNVPIPKKATQKHTQLLRQSIRCKHCLLLLSKLTRTATLPLLARAVGYGIVALNHIEYGTVGSKVRSLLREHGIAHFCCSRNARSVRLM
jgi:hypothetical protein